MSGHRGPTPSSQGMWPPGGSPHPQALPLCHAWPPPPPFPWERPPLGVGFPQVPLPPSSGRRRASRSEMPSATSGPEARSQPRRPRGSCCWVSGPSQCQPTWWAVGPPEPPWCPGDRVVSLGMKASVPAEEHSLGPSLHLTPGFSELPPERGSLPGRIQVEGAPGLPQRPFLG